jgi:HK97 family phage prohead protease
MRIVPFGERATVADGLGGVARGVPYQEEWMPGVFDKQVRAANRVWLNFEHQQGITGVLGAGVTLRQASDGYHGSFKVVDGSDGDKALALVREGFLTGASVEAVPLRGGSTRTAGGVIQRVRAHLVAVALCRVGAYAGAVVTAVRAEDPELILDEELLPVPMDPELVARCREHGFVLPHRYQAHPDETDTPAESGTSEDGTRQQTTDEPTLED